MKTAPPDCLAAPFSDYLAMSVPTAGVGRLGRLTVLNPAFIAQITAFLGFRLAFYGLAVLVCLLLDEARGLLDVSFDAHVETP